MTNRTVQIWGQGYSTPVAGLGLTPCTITATVNGTVVFSGPIPTLDSDEIARLPSEQQILFTFEIPLVTATESLDSYTLPAVFEITGDDVFLEQILSNYNINDDGTSSGPTGFQSIYADDPKSNVVVSNATFVNTPPDPRPAGTEGTWGWEVRTAPGQTSTFSFDLVIECGLE